MPVPARTEALSVPVSSVESAVLAECIDNAELADFIREAAFTSQGPFRTVDARAAAVRLLAIRDPAAAISAPQKSPCATSKDPTENNGLTS